MTADDFRRMALGLSGAVEGAHVGHPDFRVAGRIFATLRAGLQHGMVKLTPQQQRRVVRESPQSFAPENGAWGLQGATTVLLAGADEECVGEALTLAWQNIGLKATAGRRSSKPATRGSKTRSRTPKARARKQKPRAPKQKPRGR